MNLFLVEKAEHQLELIRKAIHRDTVSIPVWKQNKGDDVLFASPDSPETDWDQIALGDRWGAADTVNWFRALVQIPASMRGKTIDLILEPGPKQNNDAAAEALLYIDGVEMHGLDQWHSEVRLTAEQAKKESIHLAMRAWSGMECTYRVFSRAELASVCLEAERYYYLLKTAVLTLHEITRDSSEFHQLIELVDRSLQQVEWLYRGEKAFDTSLTRAYQVLDKGLAAMARQNKVCSIAICGHSHIDMAWLWRTHHTHEKASRTFSTVLSLMERYPEYLYSQSSPYLYEQIESRFPALFQKIRKRVKEGRWEITGSMWVEPDTNLTGAESLVRQLLLGIGYIREKFGKECHVLWLPDVFGYSWVLPQLLYRSGVRYLWTNKMSWNQYNRFPYDTFFWRGMDGSRILVQLGTCPEKNVIWGSTYNGVIAPWELKGTWDQYEQKALNKEVLMPFGWGDGGGGPTKEMLEAYPHIRRMPGLPEARMKHIEPFFHDLEKRLQDRKVPVWDGEMYFEYHRGTYTTQAQIKAANRHCEQLLHDTEWLCVFSDLVLSKQHYPARELQKIWKKLCLNQFHDILPGSSIQEVYIDAREDFEWIQKNTLRLLEGAVTALAENLGSDVPSVVLFNSLSWESSRPVKVPLPSGMTLVCRGKALPAQQITKDGADITVVDVDELPSMGWTVLPVGPQETYPQTAEVMPDGLITPFYRIRWNGHGQLCEVYDFHQNRSILAPNECGNLFEVYEDMPHAFSAWNTEKYAFDKSIPLDLLDEVMVLENGPVQASVRFVWRFHHSKIEQIMTVYHSHPGIYFDTTCYWYEKDSLLKVCFPVNIRSTRATYDIQFGNVERATHNNTSWEYAQFEVCAHKWMDLSEGNSGVAVMNNGKYGCDIKEHVMRLTLLKAATYPDPASDLGEHRFTYALLPHEGSWKTAEVARAAYELNNPCLTRLLPAMNHPVLPASCSMIQVIGDGAMVETIKRAEKDIGWIIRLYEYKQNRGLIQLHIGVPFQNAWECNLLEEDIAALNVNDGIVDIHLTPYEIKTIHIV